MQTRFITFCVQNKANVDKEKLYEVLFERTKKGFSGDTSSSEITMNAIDFEEMKIDLERVMPMTIAENVANLLKQFTQINSPRAIAVFLVNLLNEII